MTNFRTAQNRVRTYTKEVKANLAYRASKLQALEQYKGSAYYEQEAAKIDKDIEQRRVALGQTLIKELQGDLAKMRENAGKRVSKAPTADQVNTLALLAQMDTLSIREVEQYAQQMKDCPLALTRLQQIAAPFNIRVSVTPPEAVFEALDRYEGQLADYIQGYRGDADHISSIPVRQMYEFFNADDLSITGAPFKSLDEADRAFWNKFCASPVYGESPDLYEDGATPAPKAMYYFHDLDALNSYIATFTAGLEGRLKTEAENKVLENCPAEYGAKRRYYLGTGEKMPLNQPDEE